MNHTDAAPCANERAPTSPTPTPMLFNDVFSGRWTPATPSVDTWAPFPRLPPELRLSIWRLYLQRHRMVEIVMRAAAHDVLQSQYYTDRNHLGNLVSGRGYTLSIKGRGGYAASLSPLLWVNQEARQAAFSFYRVHLPFFPQQLAQPKGQVQVLCLNPEYDVVYVQTHEVWNRSVAGMGTVLADFLHDVKAYDHKDQGYVPVEFIFIYFCISFAPTN